MAMLGIGDIDNTDRRKDGGVTGDDLTKGFQSPCTHEDVRRIQRYENNIQDRMEGVPKALFRANLFRQFINSHRFFLRSIPLQLENR